MNTIENIAQKVDTDSMMAIPATDWRRILANECNCYVFGENYICRRFDQLNYKFCQKEEAKEILIDNLFSLLRYKYFPQASEEVDKKIDDIVKSFTINLKTTLVKVTLDESSDGNKVRMLPDGCIAFRNGVFDFRKNKWLFKYDVIKMQGLANTIYAYDPSYIILWYLDYNFESLDVDINDIYLEGFVDILKDLTQSNRNYCFELLYNIAHNASDSFSLDRFMHACEILGYSVLQSFSQYFIMLIGSGQNGKNSLFDGCFTNRVVPRVANNDLEALENDRFITGSLVNKAHNIFLETSAKTYTESKMLKALTGSMYQTIEEKGVNKYSSVINCKYIFAGNDQDKIKFSDTTTGFRRRINMLEIWYHWDKEKNFLRKGDYYDTTFSDSLSELKDNVLNTTIYIYLAMYGMANATKNFTQNFAFTYNDWSETKYSDIDFDLKEKIQSLTYNDFVVWIRRNMNGDEVKPAIYTQNKKRFYMDNTMFGTGLKNDFAGAVEMLNSDELRLKYFGENSWYISMRMLQELVGFNGTANAFTGEVKKAFEINKLESLWNNRPYLNVSFVNGDTIFIPKQ